MKGFDVNTRRPTVHFTCFPGPSEFQGLGWLALFFVFPETQHSTLWKSSRLVLLSFLFLHRETR